jgi:hypothetical protein
MHASCKFWRRCIVRTNITKLAPGFGRQRIDTVLVQWAIYYKLAVKFGAPALIHYRTKGWLFKYCLYGMGDARASVFLTNYYHSVVSDSSTELLTKTLPHR